MVASLENYLPLIFILIHIIYLFQDSSPKLTSLSPFSSITSNLWKSSCLSPCIINIFMPPPICAHSHTEIDSGSSTALSDLMRQSATDEDIRVEGGREVQDGSLKSQDQWTSEKQGVWSEHWKAGIFNAHYSTASYGSSTFQKVLCFMSSEWIILSCRSIDN